MRMSAGRKKEEETQLSESGVCAARVAFLQSNRVPDSSNRQSFCFFTLKSEPRPPQFLAEALSLCHVVAFIVECTL